MPHPLVGQAGAALRTAAREDLPAIPVGHPLPEAVDLGTLELLGLVLVDKDYDVKEKNFMYQLSNELGIQTDVLEEMSAKLHSYLQLCEELGELVLK